MIDNAVARRTLRLAAAVVLVAAGLTFASVPAAAATTPRVTGLSPATSPTSGGVTVNVVGAGFGAGTRVMFGSHAGTHVHVRSSSRLTVVAPPHGAGSFHVRVVRNGRTSAASSANLFVFAAPPSRVHWKAPRKVDLPLGDLSDVSCPTATFCLAVDYHGYFLTYDGTKWSQRTAVPGGGGALVSCPTPHQCTVAGGRYAFTWTNGTWTKEGPVDSHGGWSALSCPTTTFCLMIDAEGGYATRDAGTWSARKVVPNTFGAQAMDCVSATFCLLVDGAGTTVAWDGTTWHVAQGGDKFAQALSCVTASFCVTVGTYQGRVSTWNGTGWATQTLPGSPQLFDVDCVTTTSCVAVGNGGATWVLSGTTWSAVRSSHLDWTDVSCGSPNSCAALGSSQYAAAYDGTAWSTPVVVDTEQGYPTEIACSSYLFCALVDRRGAATTYVGGTWNQPQSVLPGGSLNAVACPRSSFCVAVGNGGRTVTWNGHAWAAPVTHAGIGGLVDVSCASATSCVAVSRNHALHWNGTSWRTTTVDVTVLKRIACPSTTFCLAITAGGNAVIWNGHSWSAARHVLTYARSVACAAAHECYVAGDKSLAVALHGSTWSSAFPLRRNSIKQAVSMSCPTRAYCAAALYETYDPLDDTEGSAVAGFRGAAADLRAPLRVPLSEMVSISCPSLRFCAVADGWGSVSLGTRS